MMNVLRPWVAPLGAVALGLVGGPVEAAPKPAETPVEKRDKAVKEFVARAAGALGRHDFAAFVEFCDVPFNIQRGSAGTSGIRTVKDGFAKDLADRYDGKPTFDGSKHLVRSIQTYKEARDRFDAQEATDAEAVIGAMDLVVHVELGDPGRRSHLRFLIKLLDGKPRLVGIQKVRTDE